ncbi:MAG TPA: hypothetical protein VNL91_08110, partial [Thermoanaerobaculia bacterium]|nr:hypothetical protein [Thermoanaerobaculia bacterium]
RPAEGLRLVVAEALAAGLPALLTATPAHLSLDAKSDFAAFARPENAVEIGEKLIELSADAAERERLRLRARQVALQWRPAHVAACLEASLLARLPRR